ncbi:MAG TPA: ribbon-helix-helix protein, CopG family [Gemmatimonadales bacterium]|nr:ribbon-helix-helix protein, CopG family [Gemmatimonadales bacterium]
MPYARIAITLPQDVLAELDTRAQQLDSSRSRTIVAAIRAYLSAPAVVRELAPAYAADAFGAARRTQLERDLARSPAERLAAAEELARLARTGRPRSRAGKPRQQIIGFDSYEEFYEWKKHNRA